jgi:DNA-binding MarR family transcriptional regulator
MAEKVVKVKEVEKIKDEIEKILKNSTILLTHTQIHIPTEEIELNEKEISIYDYIINNQGVIKEQVVDAFKEKAGYSRKPVFKILDRLEKKGWIKVRPDPSHGHKLHLYPNNQSEIGSFVESIASFTTNYCNLITKIKEKNLENPENDLNAIMMPVKFLIGLSNSILWDTSQHDKEILQRKIAIMSDYLETIFLELCNTLLSKGWIQNSEEIISELAYDGPNIFHPGQILNMLKMSEKYGLTRDAEIILDCLWKIGRPLIRSVYPYYSTKNSDVLVDWRILITEYETFPLPAQRPYRVLNTY